MNNLQAWRSRYSKSEYGEKVLLNVFYRKYSTFFMWDKIQNSFNGNVLWNDFNTGCREMMKLYQNQAMQTQPILLQLLSEKGNNPVGSVTYAGFADKISGARQGKNADIEEIEFTYLHYLLNDQLILMWSAFGGTGLSKIELDQGQFDGDIKVQLDPDNDEASGKVSIHKLQLSPPIYKLMLNTEPALLKLYGKFKMSNKEMKDWSAF